MRRKAIFDKINLRKKISKIGATGKQAQYHSVVNEFVIEDTNLWYVLKSWFKTGRKLKPLISQRQI